MVFSIIGMWFIAGTILIKNPVASVRLATGYLISDPLALRRRITAVVPLFKENINPHARERKQFFGYMAKEKDGIQFNLGCITAYLFRAIKFFLRSMK